MSKLVSETIKYLDEASRVDLKGVISADKIRINKLEKLFSAKFRALHHNIHGTIIDLKFKDWNRLLPSDWKKISMELDSLKVQWIEIHERSVQVGLDALHPY